MVDHKFSDAAIGIRLPGPRTQLNSKAMRILVPQLSRLDLTIGMTLVGTIIMTPSGKGTRTPFFRMCVVR